MSNPFGPDAVACPSCDHQVPGNVPRCGNCGYELGGPHMPSSVADSGDRRARSVVAVAVVAGLGALLWAGSGFIGNLIDDASVSPSEVNLPDPEEIFQGGGRGTDQIESPYKGVRELVGALNKGGLRCREAKVDSADETVASGSCQAPGPSDAVRTHVQINIYFSRPSLDIAKDIMSRRVFNYVHDANWFVITQLPTAREVHDILGGKLVRAK